MTPGFLSIKKEAVPWSKSQSEAYLALAAVGVLAGIVVAYARTPLHLPGHKALFWIPPILAARLLTGRRAGASVGALSTILTTLALSGRLAGGPVAMPLVLVAGLVLDLAVAVAQRRPGLQWRTVLLLSSAATAANLICFLKRVWETTGAFFSTGNLEDLARTAAWYACFGFLAGAIGTAFAYAAAACSRANRRTPGMGPVTNDP
jgi:hypothetical protein